MPPADHRNPGAKPRAKQRERAEKEPLPVETYHSTLTDKMNQIARQSSMARDKVHSLLKLEERVPLAKRTIALLVAELTLILIYQAIPSRKLYNAHYPSVSHQWTKQCQPKSYFLQNSIREQQLSSLSFSALLHWFTSGSRVQNGFRATNPTCI